MDPIDQLLNGLPKKVQSPVGGQSPASNPTQQESIDRLLQRLGEPQKQQVRDRLLQDLQDSTNLRTSIPWADNDTKITPTSITPTSLPREIVPSEQSIQDQDPVSPDQRKAQQLKVLKEQRQQEVRSQAPQWLKTLDPKSTEGLWFDEFACNYDSRLEAAIEYLEALQEVDRVLG